MPQQTEVVLADGSKGTVIYPDGKKLKSVRHQAKDNNVVVHYEAPHKPDLALAGMGEPNLYIVTAAVVPGLR